MTWRTLAALRRVRIRGLGNEGQRNQLHGEDSLQFLIRQINHLVHPPVINIPPILALIRKY